jgi:hypothetical protein
MKKHLLAIAWLLTAALFSMSCATGQVALFPQRPAGPDQGVVEDLMCRGQEAMAQVYLEDRGASRAERTERIERARDRALKRAAAGQPCCPEGACTAPAPAPVLRPEPK